MEEGHGPSGINSPEGLEEWPTRRLERAIARAKDTKADADLMRMITLFVVGGARFLEMWRVYSKGKRTKLLGLGTAMQNTIDRSRNDIRRIARAMRGKFRSNPGVSITLNLAVCIGSVILSNGFAQTRIAQHPMANFISNFAMEQFGSGGSGGGSGSGGGGGGGYANNNNNDMNNFMQGGNGGNRDENDLKEGGSKEGGGFLDTLTSMIQGLSSATTAPNMKPASATHSNAANSKATADHSKMGTAKGNVYFVDTAVHAGSGTARDSMGLDEDGFDASAKRRNATTTFRVRPNVNVNSNVNSNVDALWGNMMNK